MYKCQACKKEFEKKTSLAAHVNAVHNKEKCKYCGREIGIPNIKKHEKACDKNPENFHICNNDECNNLTANPKYCCRLCANQDRALNETKKLRGKKICCKFCRKELIGKKRRQTYCSKKCVQLQKRYEYIYKWKSGFVSGSKSSGAGTSSRVKKYLRDRYGDSCQRCGWSENNIYTGKVPLEIHHIDGDWANDRLENLQLLCPNCHALTKTFRGANQGNIKSGIVRSKQSIKYRQEKIDVL